MYYLYEDENYSLTAIVTGFFKENSYLLQNRQSKKSILIDPGDDFELIDQIIVQSQAEVEAILLTHGHFDHLAASAKIQEKKNIPCIVHSNDKKLIRLASFYSARFCKTTVRPPQSIHFLQDETFLDISHFQFNIISTPGHTQGSLCYLFHNWIFTGDTLFYQAIGPTRPPDGNQAQLHQSVDHLLQTTPHHIQLFPGHGKPWTVREANQWWMSGERGEMKDVPA